MRKLQKTVSFLLSFILVLGLCIATVPGEAKAEGGVQFTVTADKTKLQRGDTVNVTVSMSGNTEGYGLRYKLIYKLEPVGEPQPGEVFQDSEIGAQSCNWSAVDSAVLSTITKASNKSPIKNGTLMTVQFKVLDNAQPGTFGFTYDIDMKTADRNPVTVQDASVDLDVVIPVTGITLDKQEMNMVIGQTDTLTATLAPEGVSSTVAWESSNEAAATVTQDGTVTAVSSGEAVIKATADGKSAECKVCVEAPKIPMTDISVSDMEISRGQTKPLEVKYSPDNTTDDKAVTYESSDPDVATVDGAGAVTGKKAGTATITVKTTKTATPFTATATVKVIEKSITDEAEKIAFTDMDEPVLKGNHGQTVDMNDFLNIKDIIRENQITDIYKIQWSSSDEKVATVNAEGKVTGIKEGKATIQAVITFTDGEGNTTKTVKVATDINVKEIPLESIAFDKIIKEMVVGTTETLSIIYNPDNTTDLRDVKWESSDSSILSVENGKVTALKVGEAEITATVGDKKASCKITVKEGSVTPTPKPGQDKADSTKTDSAKTNSPKTGDTANVVWYAVMLLLSMAAVLFGYKRRFCKAGK